ncbi:uncharacterized protein LOC130934181 [Arachis stenosperma]|uniref:uncharacterized protein LOC130934181 n=1 Tax=Arachis stenosperma TaxID=217475 RepID=UPI0025AC3908|nr:uncharacterized protein LOC130934181 [Arachis stenosperma]
MMIHIDTEVARIKSSIMQFINEEAERNKEAGPNEKKLVYGETWYVYEQGTGQREGSGDVTAPRGKHGGAVVEQRQWRMGLNGGGLGGDSREEGVRVVVVAGGGGPWRSEASRDGEGSGGGEGKEEGKKEERGKCGGCGVVVWAAGGGC